MGEWGSWQILKAGDKMERREKAYMADLLNPVCEMLIGPVEFD